MPTQTRVPVVAASSFVAALHSTGPASDRADSLKLYGWLIGRWTMDATVYRGDGTRHQGPGEIHFGWVLEGRAIQDVWIFPGVFYGTTLRVYDPNIDAWHILWSDPLRQVYTRRSGGRRAPTLSSSATTMPGRRCAGALRKSRRTRSAGPASARATAARPGNCRPTSPLSASDDCNRNL